MCIRDRASALWQRAVVARSLYRYDEADSLFQRALDLAARGHASPDLVGNLWNDLGLLRLDVGRYGAALEALRRAYALSGDRPADDPGRVTTLANMGIALDGICLLYTSRCV